MNDNISDQKRWTWPAQVIKDILLAGLANNSYHAVQMLRKSAAISPSTEHGAIMAWTRAYRVARNAGENGEMAARIADDAARGPLHAGTTNAFQAAAARMGAER